MSCLFCQIVEKKVPAKLAYEDDQVMAFHDIRPQAPVHVLVIPRKHITSLMDVTAGDDAVVGGLVRRGRELAREMGLGERGFRLVFNTGDDAGYSVYHVHLHLLGGRVLGWPPG
jgi:histidine triad (HIT) family protein